MPESRLGGTGETRGCAHEAPSEVARGHCDERRTGRRGLRAPGATAASGAATAKPSGPRIKPVLTTPIKHVVVIFGENVSFDHYFGTYPERRRTPTARRSPPKTGTPSVNGLSGALLTANPNGVNPKRYDPTQRRTTCSPATRTTYYGRSRRRSTTGDGQVPGRGRHRYRRVADRRGVRGRRRHELLRRQHRDRACGTTRSTSR